MFEKMSLLDYAIKSEWEDFCIDYQGYVTMDYEELEAYFPELYDLLQEHTIHEIAKMFVDVHVTKHTKQDCLDSLAYYTKEHINAEYELITSEIVDMIEDVS